MTPLLELKRIKKSFPGVKALDGIDLAIQRGEVHALLGENGAGKSTLVKIMCGIYQPDEGDIFIDGEQRRFNNYRQAIEAGVGIIFQEFSLIPYMSAIDNIFLNREIRNRWGLLDRRAMRRKAEAIFKRLTVAIDLDCPVEQLSVAQQQFVEIAKALAQGIGLLPESRKTEGLVLPFSVAQNITLNRHHRRGKIFVSARKDRDVVQRLIRAVGVKTPDAETAVSTLSGGNQQKVVIARWLNNDCNILIFDEPTRGIDVGAKAEIYQLMQQLTQQGISIIMISSELPEIIGVCDRVLVFRGGHIVAELTGDDIESNHIMLHATGSAL
ncbi:MULTISPECIES: ATP-binding cassette domain-containing protein [unclassified Serratia (in: enterobacteria)]|uniref:ATP-binding cassette domain-containing protein n=1 Tax=unclassified Serratia (in: enterobacteria) TaxID=2647522 RepID=UPI003B43998E